MKKAKLLIVGGIAVVLSSCSITLPVNASGEPIGKKVGTAKANVILGMAFNADASIKSAAKNGGITKVATVDIKHFNALGIFQYYETIVTGE
ncbi:MAG: TRL-like family protein [Sediminibacterium sp.]|nr:TRL-like family protein [Sediminibacterium sp.]